jgi:DMSO/TMAO reductase YedYZ molybdopterin-dependent catalytic subunit
VASPNHREATSTRPDAVVFAAIRGRDIILIRYNMQTEMGRSEYIETTKRIRRREFLIKALASGGVASRYLGSPAFFVAKNIFSQVPQTYTSNPNSKELVTANVDFFVRNHFTTPKISDEAWRLEIGGLVSKPLKLSYSDLLLMASVRRPSTLECAGNATGGAGVGTAVWSGLPLGELLQQAGVKPGTTTIVFYGADSGEGENVPPGTHFARAIPLEKAMEPATLLAYEMNGEPLPAEHGFPLRVLVPGWYGMDSVKWLTRIEVLDRPFKGYFQDEKYVALRAQGASRPLTFIQVNSKFLRPSEGEEIRGKTYRVEGVAWAGERKIARVEVRVGGGAWQAANLSVSPSALIWTPWSYEWQVPTSGRYTLEVRATDTESGSQPEVRDPDRKDPYELNTPHSVNVTVP